MSDDTLANRPSGEVSTTPAGKFRAYMAQRAAQESSQNAEDVSANQVGRVFAAETADDILNSVSGGTVQARDVVGLEIEIHSMRMQESDRYEGSPYYANLDVTILGGPREILARSGPVGSQIVLQTGAEIAIAQVRALEAKGFLPYKAVVAGTETSNGFTVIKLGPMPERTTTTTK